MTTRRSLRPKRPDVAASGKTMASPAFERFRFSFFEDPDLPRNGLDMKALAALEGEERSRAEDMLLQYLPDTRGVIGLRFQRPAAHDVSGDVGRRRTKRGRQAGDPRGHRRAADLRAMSSAGDVGAGRKPVLGNFGERDLQVAQKATPKRRPTLQTTRQRFLVPPNTNSNRLGSLGCPKTSRQAPPGE